MRLTDADIDRFWLKVAKGEGCWTWQAGTTVDGYGTFWLPTHRKDVRAHRVSWQLANGEIPNGLCVCHRCDTPACVNPEHLFLGTHAENMADMKAKGRGRTDPTWKGAAVNWAKLTEDQAREVIALRATGLKLKEIGARFNICEAAVSLICSGKNWPHLQEAV